MKVEISCTVCYKPVKSNQNGILCNCCNQWTHAKCVCMCKEEYLKLSSTDEVWFCSSCLQTIFPFNHIPDDEEFLMVTTDSVDYLNLHFDPFTCEENRPLLNTDDLDPDINYYNNIPFVL